MACNKKRQWRRSSKSRAGCKLMNNMKALASRKEAAKEEES